MWQITYVDGTSISSEERNWSEVSERVTRDGATYDILRQPASEIRIFLTPGHVGHRLRAPTSAGEHFFHYQRARLNLGTGEAQQLYIAAGFFLAPGSGRVVTEIAPNSQTTRVEYGTPQF